MSFNTEEVENVTQLGDETVSMMNYTAEAPGLSVDETPESMNRSGGVQEEEVQQEQQQHEEEEDGREVVESGTSAVQQKSILKSSGARDERSPKSVKMLRNVSAPPARNKQLGASKANTALQMLSGHPSSVHRSNTLASKRVAAPSTMTRVCNAYNMTTGEENMVFRARNGISPNFTGFVYVDEEIYVMCARCNTPVDAVSRVPAGKLFFHPGCIRCELCDRRSPTDLYFQCMSNRAICSECSAKGFARCVAREAAASRGIVVGAVKGSIDRAIQRYDRNRRL